MSMHTEAGPTHTGLTTKPFTRFPGHECNVRTGGREAGLHGTLRASRNFNRGAVAKESAVIARTKGQWEPIEEAGPESVAALCLC